MSGSCCPNLCPECGLLHHNATVEGCLRIQVKALRAEVAALKAELAKRDEPLTVSDLAAVLIEVGPIGDRSPARFVGDIDAAIRRIRRGE